MTAQKSPQTVGSANVLRCKGKAEAEAPLVGAGWPVMFGWRPDSRVKTVETDGKCPAQPLPEKEENCRSPNNVMRRLILIELTVPVRHAPLRQPHPGLWLELRRSRPKGDHHRGADIIKIHTQRHCACLRTSCAQVGSFYASWVAVDVFARQRAAMRQVEVETKPKTVLGSRQALEFRRNLTS